MTNIGVRLICESVAILFCAVFYNSLILHRYNFYLQFSRVVKGISPMWIKAVWHGKCNTLPDKILHMKKTILFNLAVILVYYFLLRAFLPF